MVTAIAFPAALADTVDAVYSSAGLEKLVLCVGTVAGAVYPLPATLYDTAMVSPAAADATRKVNVQLLGLLVLPFHDADDDLISYVCDWPPTVPVTTMALPVPM